MTSPTRESTHLVEEYFKAVIERYGKSPALSFYNIWNEPHYNSTAGHVIERFRKWLQAKYGNLSSLRRAWGKEYSEWDQVSPFLTDNWNSSMPQIDWVTFRNELNGALLHQLVQTLRKYDTVHPVNANPVGTPWANFNNFGWYNIDNWPIADNDDIDGISYYPDGWEREHNLEPCPFWLHNLTFNTIRSASGKKNYILTELYTNAQNGLTLNGYLGRDFTGGASMDCARERLQRDHVLEVDSVYAGASVPRERVDSSRWSSCSPR